MPYFKWSGITTTGEFTWGKSFARSVEQLQNGLQHQQVSLIYAHIIVFYRRPSIDEKAVWLYRLGTLLDAGIRLHDALLLTQKSIKNKYLRCVVEDLADAIGEGSSLSSALYFYDDLFDSALIQLLEAGERAGSLAKALLCAAQHVERRALFKKTVRGALLMPFITLAFFFLIVLILLLFVIPRFEILFASMHTTGELPWATQVLFSLSNFVRSWGMLYLLVMAALLGGILFFIMRRTAISNVIQRILLKLPIIGSFLRDRARVIFVQTTAVLLEGGVRLSQALRHAVVAVQPQFLQQPYEQLAYDVATGESFADALVKQKTLVTPEFEALVRVGEKTGLLTSMVHHVATHLQATFEQRLKTATTFIQPALLLFLGILIACMVGMLYLPLISLHEVIG